MVIRKQLQCQRLGRQAWPFQREVEWCLGPFSHCSGVASIDIMLPWLGRFSFPSPEIHIVISLKTALIDTPRNNALVASYLPEYYILMLSPR